MKAFKNIRKNVALFLFVGAIPLIGWASGYFVAFSWTSFFFLIGGCFCILWLKERQYTQILRNILLSRDDAWALCEGEQIIDQSPFFPSPSLQSFKEFLHVDFLQEVELAITELIHKNVPFKMKVYAASGNAIYVFEGEPLKEKIIFWLRNITASTHLVQLYNENLKKKESLLDKLQKTLDMLPVLIWHRDKDQRITYCNLAYSAAVGAVSQVVQREGIELIQPRIARMLARKAINTSEYQFFESTGAAENEKRHFRICEIPNPLEQGTLGVAFDITDLKDAQKEIKNLSDAHNEVLAYLSTAIAIYDAAGTLQYYNQAYVSLNSFDEDFLKTHPCLNEVLEELRNRRQLPEYVDFPAYKKKCLQQLTEQIEPLEEMMHLPDERTIRNFSAPHPMGGLLFMFEDVTNYLTLERKNKTLLDSYQTTLDNLFEGVIVIGSDNRLKTFNSGFCELWNFNEKDVEVGQHLTFIVDKLKNFIDYEVDWETYKAQFIESVTDRVPKSGQLKRKDGIILNFGYAPLPNGNHFVSYIDITDTCRVQKVLQEKNKALERANHLKQKFVESFSFELKSPLNTVVEFTEILRYEYFGELNKRQMDYVEGILESSTTLRYLVNDILDLVSIEAGYLTLNPRVLEIPKILKNITKIIAKKAEQNQQHFIIKCDQQVNEWIVDEQRLKQVLLNLLNNAIKFMPPNGKITLEAKIVQDELVLSIANTGVGVSIDEYFLLLDKLEHGKVNPHTDPGIGLSLAKSLIELHGGRIELVSEVNKGTTVHCFLPRIPLANQDKDQMTISVGK